MKKKLLTTTDFSPSAANALDYACNYAAAFNMDILLVHIYNFPPGYAAESLSLATINDAMDAEQDMLEQERLRVAMLFPEMSIESRMMSGNFADELQKLYQNEGASMIVMGAFGAFSDLGLWKDQPLRALTNMAGPVLVVPEGVRYQPLKNIAIACDYKKSCSADHIGLIHELTSNSGAALHIVHVMKTPTESEDAQKIGTAIKESLSDLNPTITELHNEDVIASVVAFVIEKNIDLLMVIPRSHSFWYNLFNKSHSQQLAQLNNTPVLALHEE